MKQPTKAYLKNKIAKLEKELKITKQERNDFIDISQITRCKKCKRYAVMPGYICMFCRQDPHLPIEG